MVSRRHRPTMQNPWRVTEFQHRSGAKPITWHPDWVVCILNDGPSRLEPFAILQTFQWLCWKQWNNSWWIISFHINRAVLTHLGPLVLYKTRHPFFPRARKESLSHTAQVRATAEWGAERALFLQTEPTGLFQMKFQLGWEGWEGISALKHQTLPTLRNSHDRLRGFLLQGCLSFLYVKLFLWKHDRGVTVRWQS